MNYQNLNPITPMMAWNAWNTFSQDGKPIRGGLSEYKSIANAIVESGMRDAGYNLISTVCTDWTGRDPKTGVLQQNSTLWPGGMYAFSNHLHKQGLLLSVYTDAGTLNCCQEPGSAGYEDIDMQTFADWGADFVVVDFCYSVPGATDNVKATFQKFTDAITKSSNPKMQLGIYNLGLGRAWTWAPAMGAPLFRVLSDIGNSWNQSGQGHLLGIMPSVDAIQAVPDLNLYGTGNMSGSYPTYGQMIVGVPPDHPTKGDPGLTLVEAQSHFSMWCMFPSPLLATNDVRLRNASIEAILLNPETIAINQDPWGLPAFRINIGNQLWRTDLGIDPRTPTLLQWARHLANGDIAALLLNRDDNQIQQTTLHFADFLDGVPGGSYRVRDIQNRRDLGVACAKISFSLIPHQTAFVRLSLVNKTCLTRDLVNSLYI